MLRELRPKGFLGISHSLQKINFYANNESIILTLVHLIFPIFINPNIGLGVEKLPEPFVPFNYMRPHFVNFTKKELVRHKTTFC